VWEWCEDDWHEDYENAPNDGSAWVSSEKSKKVVRGGSWFFNPYICRSASRNNNTRDNRNNNIGFRVVCVAPSTLLCQSWQMGICQACKERVQTCSGDVE
jgi:formylglycine-generating enzyme required for sulfatase activity